MAAADAEDSRSPEVVWAEERAIDVDGMVLNGRTPQVDRGPKKMRDDLLFEAFSSIAPYVAFETHFARAFG